MKVTTERLENCQANIIVELDAAETDQRLRQTARKISQKLTVPGYRRGKAPFQAVIRTFGREAVQQEALDEWGQELYEQALNESGYDPFQQGELKDVEWNPFRMTVLLPLKPELDLGDYRAVRVPLEPEPVTEEQVAGYLAGLQKEHGQWVPAERPAETGDQIVIHATGKVGEEVVLELANQELLLDAEAKEPLPGFHAQIAGLSAGEEKTFVLTYPADHAQKAAAGKEATFVVKVQSVKEEDLPPLDDELATMVGDYNTLDDLKAGVRSNLETEARQKAESEYLDRTLDAMIQGAVKIEYPPQAVDREAEIAVERMERNLSSAGLQLDTYLRMIGKTRAVYLSELRPAAAERLKKRLALVEIVRRESLKVGEEEIDAEVKRLSALLGDEDAEMRGFLTTPAGRLSVTDDLVMGKVRERVVQIGKGEAPALEVGTTESASEAGEPVPEAGEPVVEAGQSAVEVGEPEANGGEVTVEAPAVLGEG